MDICKALAKFETVNMKSDIGTDLEEYFKAEEQYYIDLKNTLASFIKPLQITELQRVGISDKYRNEDRIGSPLRYSLESKQIGRYIEEASYWYIELIANYYAKAKNIEIVMGDVYQKLGLTKETGHGGYTYNMSAEDRQKKEDAKNRQIEWLLNNNISYQKILDAIYSSFNGMSIDEISVKNQLEKFKQSNYGMTYKADKIQFRDCFSKPKGYSGFQKYQKFDDVLKMLSYHYTKSFELMECLTIMELESPRESNCLKEIKIEHDKIISCRYLRTGVFEVTFIDPAEAEGFYVSFLRS